MLGSISECHGPWDVGMETSAASLGIAARQSVGVCGTTRSGTAQVARLRIPSASRLVQPMVVTGIACGPTRAAPRNSAPVCRVRLLLSLRVGESEPSSITACSVQL